jgi:hypothetical protein
METEIDNVMKEERMVVVDALREGGRLIHFEKANGELREMFASLNPNDYSTYEFKSDQQETAEEKILNKTLSVWSIRDNGWRSFKWANLRKVEGLDPMKNGL